MAIIAASAATAACRHDARRGRRTDRLAQLSGRQFPADRGRRPYDVQVRTGANPSRLSASGREKLLERTVVEVKGDKLVIHPENQHGWFHFGWRPSRQGDVRRHRSAAQRRDHRRLGRHQDRQGQGDRLRGHGRRLGRARCRSIDVQQLKLVDRRFGQRQGRSGKAQTAEYDIAGSGDVDAAQCPDAATSRCRSPARAASRPTPRGTADVSIMGSGDVDVAGGAKCTVSKAGSGNVRCS